MIFKRILHRRSFFVAIVVLVIAPLLFYYVREARKVSYTPTAYEKELIDYFKEIALQSEYYDNSQKTIKWEKPMSLYVVKEKELKSQMSVIKKAINKINDLATDGFKIKLTNNLSNSNAVLYLCKKARVAELAPQFYEILTDGIDYEISGYAYSQYATDTHIINKALIFVSTEEAFNVQESTILEELAQSLGLAFDSKKYANSIFYKNKSEQEIRTSEYSRLDRDLIRLLYHPKMEPGLDSTGLNKALKKILKSEKN
ncbi:DUF2927 domain-containing protein [Flagellimonas sp. 389]|uniref:DUF2927 domain-containing protein n=1 Tax=Flagellimonas sp. 389 TaxID=2835862 RepID=UPI001BD4618F|nr:DUF2927 domain-containing protein [Flagellimonas sp. 389]MBS9464395.1 DUF2927 domain-containing protein [Flagellimonas sp. 389]